MNKKSRLAAIALVAALGVATPPVAVAQDLETGTAANREQLFGYGPSRNGFSAYAEVPGSVSGRHGGYLWRAPELAGRPFGGGHSRA